MLVGLEGVGVGGGLLKHHIYVVWSRCEALALYLVLSECQHVSTRPLRPAISWVCQECQQPAPDNTRSLTTHNNYTTYQCHPPSLQR